MSDRTYTEREVADLIGRAVERQQEASRRASSVGLTLDEVEHIGRETGIDPIHLREAAAEMDAVGRTLSRQSGHTDTHVTAERWIDAPLSPEGWEDAVAHLQDNFGLSMTAGMGVAGGTVQQVGNAYEWQHTSGLGVQTTVTASPRDGRTRLRMRQLVGLGSPTKESLGYGFLLALVIGVLGALAGSALGAGSGAVSMLAAFLAFAVAWAVATPVIAHLDRRWRAGKLRTLDALADDLSTILMTPASGASAPDRAADPAHLGDRVPEAGLLDASLLDADTPEASDTSSARRVRE